MLTKKEIQEIIEKAESQKRELESLINSLRNVQVKEFGRAKNDDVYWFVNYGRLVDSDIEADLKKILNSKWEMEPSKS